MTDHGSVRIIVTDDWLAAAAEEDCSPAEFAVRALHGRIARHAQVRDAGGIDPFLDMMAVAVFRKALDDHRAGELLKALFDGAACTIDGETGELVIIRVGDLDLRVVQE